MERIHSSIPLETVSRTNNVVRTNKKRSAKKEEEGIRKQSIRRRKSNKKTLYGRSKKYSHNIYKLMKCILPGASIDVLAMNIMNSFVEDLLERISTEASHLVKYSKKSTMSSDDIISATKLVLTTHQLRDNAINMANRTLNYTNKSR